MIKFKEIITGYLPIWVSPNGQLNKAVNGHATYAQENLGMENLGMEISDEFDDTEKAYDGMYSKGYVRVTAEVGNVFLTHDEKKPSRIQIKSIKDLGIENNSVVTDDVTQKVLYSPHLSESENNTLEEAYEYRN